MIVLLSQKLDIFQCILKKGKAVFKPMMTGGDDY